MPAIPALLLAALGGGPFAFPEPQIAVAPQARSPRAGDLDGDGRPDVVAVDRGGDALLVARNAGAGVLLPPAALPTGPAPELVRLARVDGDGALDAVVAWTGGTSGGLSVHLGDGLGGFGPRTDFPLPVVPAALVLADLDGDGNVDVLVLGAAPDDATVVARLGDGAGGLGPAVATDLGAAASAVDVGDLDGDAAADLFAAVPQPGASAVRLFAGAGDGSFAPAGSLAVDDLPQSIAVGDLDGDGVDDVTVVSGPTFPASGLLARYLGDGAGGFGAPFSVMTGVGSSSHALADIDVDGHLDVAVQSGPPALLDSQFLVHFGGAGGVLGPLHTVSIRPDSSGFDFADLDGQPGLDLVYAQPGAAPSTDPVGFLGMVIQTGRREFSSARLVRTGVFSGIVARSADLDGDGLGDVVAAGRSGSPQTHALVVQRGDGAGGFLPPRRTSYPLQLPGVQALDLGDLGTDGLLDAVVWQGGELLVFTGRPDTSFAAPWTTTTTLFGYLGSADLDGDGRHELLASRAVSGGGFEVVLLRFTGSALVELTAVPTSGAAQLARTADVDGDGVLDLVVGVSNPSSLQVHRGAGGLAFFPPQSVPAPPSLFDLVAGDLDGDGLPELAGAVGGSGSKHIVVWPNLGGALAEPRRHPVGQFPSRLVAADLDGDGRQELVVAHALGENLAVVALEPGGALAPARFFALPRRATSLDVFRRSPAARPDVLFATGGDPLALIFEAFGLLPNATAPGPR